MNLSLNKASVNNVIKPKKNKKPGRYKLFFMTVPFLILCFLFSYLPLYGWKYAFYDYKVGMQLSQCQYVGFQWFKSLIANPVQRGEVIRVMQNTFAMSGLGILTSFLPLMFAIFLVEISRTWFKSIVQTLTTIPNFISWVLVFSFAFCLLSNTGFVNQLLIQIGLIKHPITFLASDSHTWLEMWLWGQWKGLGWGAIMYLAAISGIDAELYEAAKVDGAGRFRMMWNITVPSLLPTYFVLLMLSISGFLNNGMDQYFVFQNAINKAHIEVLDLYVYNIGLGGGSFSLATAVSILKSLVSIVLLALTNGMSKLFRGETIV
jgi:putative aldouronate transport system permease protein